MAIRTIEIRKAIDDNSKALAKVRAKIDSFATRESAIAEKIEKAVADEERASIDAEVEAFNTEKAETSAEEERLKSTIAELEKELESLEADEPSKADNPIERETHKMSEMVTRDSREYIDAYVRYIKTGKDAEVRGLLTENASGGTVAVPTMVDGIVRHAWEEDTILKDIRKTYLMGNVKVGFEISSTGAVVHTEGEDAIDEEELVLGIVTMTPSHIKKFIRISDEALAMNGEAFLTYIYEELAQMIAKKLADEIVAAIKGASASSTSTAVGVPQLTKAVAVDTVAQALALLSGEASNPCIIMNRRTWAAFKGVQYANGFAVDVFEGCEVKFNDTLPAYASATSGAVYMIVGDLNGVQANFPNGDEILFKYDDLTEAEADMVKIHGREYVGYGITDPKHFVNVKKPS